jgi:uridine kinase
MDLIDALSDLCKSQLQPIIAIDGPAGAGKTSLASLLKSALSQEYSVNVIHMDDLYLGWDRTLTSELSETLGFIVSSHKEKKAISLSFYDWQHETLLPVHEIPSSQLLILEGVGSGQREIRDQLTTLIWMEIDQKQGLARVLQRDGDEIESQMRKWLETQEQHFSDEETQKAADFELTT